MEPPTRWLRASPLLLWCSVLFGAMIIRWKDAQALSAENFPIIATVDREPPGDPFILIRPFPENGSSTRHPRVLHHSVGAFHVITIECNARFEQGITVMCYELIMAQVGRRGIVPKAVVEVQDSWELGQLITTLLINLRIDAFYVRCIGESPFNRTESLCSSEPSRSFDVIEYIQGKYFDMEPLRILALKKNLSPTVYCYRRIQLAIDSESTQLTDRDNQPVKPPYNETLLWSTTRGLFFVDGGSPLLQHEKQMLKEGRGQKAPHYLNVSSKDRVFNLKGVPINFTHRFSSGTMAIYDVKQRLVTPLNPSGPSHEPKTYVFLLHPALKSHLTNLTTVRTSEGGIYSIDCYSGNIVSLMNKCLEEVAGSAKGGLDPTTSIYVVSPNSRRMQLFTVQMNEQMGVARMISIRSMGGREAKWVLWPKYIKLMLPKEGEAARRSLEQPSSKPGKRDSADAEEAEMKKFNFALVESFATERGGIVAYNQQLCWKFKFSYDPNIWKLRIDGRDTNWGLESDFLSRLHFDWQLTRIVVGGLKADRSRKIEMLMSQPDGTRFRLEPKNKFLNPHRDFLKIDCNGIKDEKTQAVEWQRYSAVIANNRGFIRSKV